jgi:DNA-binding response OmpR family regulator
MTRVLVVEDSPDLAFGLQSNLEIEGYETRVAADGEAALQEYANFSPDIVVLDLMIPKLSGFEVLQALRDQGSNVPVLILSAQKEETAKIRGFRLGADDFVTKPFSVLELIARLQALLRRANLRPTTAQGQPAGPLKFDDVEVQPETKTVYRKGKRVELSPKAFELLIALIKGEGGISKRQDLLRDVWGHRHLVSTRTVDFHMLELRQKLEEDPSKPQHFLTVRKVGYRFQR